MKAKNYQAKIVKVFLFSFCSFKKKKKDFFSQIRKTHLKKISIVQKKRNEEKNFVVVQQKKKQKNKLKKNNVKQLKINQFLFSFFFFLFAGKNINLMEFSLAENMLNKKIK